jgi:hypothetical protein
MQRLSDADCPLHIRYALVAVLQGRSWLVAAYKKANNIIISNIFSSLLFACE